MTTSPAEYNHGKENVEEGRRKAIRKNTLQWPGFEPMNFVTRVEHFIHLTTLACQVTAIH